MARVATTFDSYGKHINMCDMIVRHLDELHHVGDIDSNPLHSHEHARGLIHPACRERKLIRLLMF